jgi:Flp pilus assembly protein TadD
MYLSGKVVTEDGSPFPETIVVELVCHGSVRRQVHSFKGGHFSFDLSPRPSAAFLDASVGSNDANNVNPFARVPQGEYRAGGEQVDLSGCEVRPNLPGFVSDRIRLGLRRALDRPDIGTIVVKRREGVVGSTVSFTALAAPKKARKAYAKAEKELRKEKKNMAKVRKELEKAIQVYPKYAAAWHLLGMIRMADQEEEGARQAFEASIESDENYIRPYLSLVDMEVRAGAWPRVSELCGKVVELNPFMVRCQYYHAVASLNLGRMEAAEASAIKVQETQDSRFLSGSHYIRGAVLARKGDFESAAEQFRDFLKIAPEGRGTAQIKENLVAWEQQGLIQAHNPSPTQAERTVQ